MSDKSKAVDCTCLCGAVEFRATIKVADVGACHCSMCRRWSGGVFLALESDGPLEFNDGSTVGTYKSSDWGERGFCKTCGSSLFWRTLDGSHNVISAQCVKGLEAPKLGSEIFIDEKPAYYEFAQDTHKMTGAEFMAQFASPAPDKS